jgi:hypothetical protein
LSTYTYRVLDEGSQNVSHKFPGMAPVSHAQEQAMRVSQFHAVHLVYRDTATNSVRPCVVVMHPHCAIPTIGKFISWLNTLVTADPAPAKSGPWNSVEVSIDGSSNYVDGSTGSRVRRSRRSCFCCCGR